MDDKTTILKNTDLYLSQLKRWPISGRHIMAHFDDRAVVVYQAYRPAIGLPAATNQKFPQEFSLNRMSWIKPNFLWMMYRSGWGAKEGQEVTLAIWLRREAFDHILDIAVHSAYVPEVYISPASWRRQLADSEVRLQWDPDHDPSGAKQDRRAIQLGLSGATVKKYCQEWILKIENISDFVTQQRAEFTNHGLARLITPNESVYPVGNVGVATHLGIDAASAQ